MASTLTLALVSQCRWSHFFFTFSLSLLPFSLICLVFTNIKLTYEQVCCLVLNCLRVKKIVKSENILWHKPSRCFYLDSFGSIRPIAIDRDLISHDPFTYRSYTNNFPLSPSKLPNCSVEDTEHIKYGSNNNNEADTYELFPVTKGECFARPQKKSFQIHNPSTAKYMKSCL